VDKVAARPGDAAFTSWMASAAVRMHLNERATGDPARDWLSAWAPQYFGGVDLRVLVLGGADRALERTIAEWPFVARIDVVVDLDRDHLEADAYDVVVAHMALHKVEQLEEAFSQIERAMKDDSFVIVNEHTGPRRFQYSDDVGTMIDALAAAMGIAPREQPADASAAVRSDELLPMLYERFDVVDVRRMGGTLLQHLLYDVAQNYRFEDPRERSIIDLLCTFEGALVDTGAIPSAFNILAARKRGSGAIPVQRPLPPRDLAANDVEPDPLRMRRRTKSEGRAAGSLEAWHLRLLRIALSSTQPRRANVFEEQPMHAAMERFRFALARTSAFDWIISRYRAYGSDAVILALLQTFDRLAPE
jgi:SAM-dependent methyltransferase